MKSAVSHAIEPAQRCKDAMGPGPEPGTVEDPRHEGVASVHLRQDRPHLGFGQDYRHPRRALSALDVVEQFEFPPRTSL